jgi:hypothetical protein
LIIAPPDRLIEPTASVTVAVKVGPFDKVMLLLEAMSQEVAAILAPP